jgi:lysophospholipase L1-like esterase
MKNVLCYGDSNTWGFTPGTKARYPHDVRWTGILRKGLGGEFNVIEEGQNGRTTLWDDPISGGQKNGKTYLGPCLESHKPLDLVVIMLGTNDLKKRFSLTAFDVAAAAGVLVNVVAGSGSGRGGKSPKVLLISPPHVGNMEKSEYKEMFNGNESTARSHEFAKYFRLVAEQSGCGFLDAAELVTPSTIDAIHFDSDEHFKLGQAVAEKVREIIG